MGLTWNMSERRNNWRRTNQGDGKYDKVNMGLNEGQGVILGRNTEPNNHFVWEIVITKLPGTPTYDC